MAIGDVERVTTGDCTDLWYVDTGMYDCPEYGSVYVLDAERPAVVDTGIGTNYERILDALDAAALEPADVEVIAVTHVHLDHAGGAGFLAEACENATVVVHERGARHLVDPSRLVAGTKQAVGDQWQYYTEPKPVPEDRIREVDDGDAVDLGDHALEVVHAPGHAPHQVVFADPANDAVFTADAAGIYVPSLDVVRETTPPPQFDLEQALDDVATLRERDPGTLLYAHFGPSPEGAADDLLAEYAERLQEWVAAVEEKRTELDDDAVADHFAATTDTEAVWGEHKARAEAAMNVRGVVTYLDR